LAIARALGEEGYALTVSGRRRGKLEDAAEQLRSEGLEVEAVVAQMVEEEEVVALVAAHKERYGRMDVLVNNAGIGIGQPMDSIQTKHLDIQLGVNLRSVILATRESLPMLREAGAEHGKALIVNTASIAGKIGEAWLSVYSATKAAVINFSQATQKEIGEGGIQVTALAPGFVDTPMTDFVKESVAAEKMIRPEDIAEAVRLLLRTSPNCLIPEIVFVRPGDLTSP
jgi:NAD(P)-dependent dehydrogenase (short-subunit alcohol dehydrogenase family)